MTTVFGDSLLEILQEAKDRLLHSDDGKMVVRSGSSFDNHRNGDEREALGRFLFKKIRELSDVGRVTIEGTSGDLTQAQGTAWVTVDPIDGALNFQSRKMTVGLPHTCCVTVLNTVTSATFENVQNAVILDLRRGIDDLWWTLIDDDCRCSYVNKRTPIRTSDAKRLDLGSQIVFGDFYYPQNREKLVHAFQGMDGWLRSTGSAAYEMACVASGQAVAYICDRQKQHELGAGYALVKGACGVAVDWNGEDLGSRRYDFTSQTPVILAANAHIADDILKLLHRGERTMM